MTTMSPSTPTPARTTRSDVLPPCQPTPGGQRTAWRALTAATIPSGAFGHGSGARGWLLPGASSALAAYLLLEVNVPERPALFRNKTSYAWNAPDTMDSAASPLTSLTAVTSMPLCRRIGGYRW
jgi:hypothetical protein